MSHASERCNVTRKRRFRDHFEAIKALHRLQERSTRDTVQQRVYECDACEGWHLTSQKVWGENVKDPTRRRGL